MTDNPYQRLAQQLDALPDGYPPTDSGVELRLLAKLFAPDEAALAAQLRLTPETPAEVAARTGADRQAVRKQLKAMGRRGLIHVQRTERGLCYGLLAFVVGIYEHQIKTIDAEMARLFEDYFQQAFGQAIGDQPAVHRVIPVGESIEAGIEIRPFESVAQIVDSAQAWAVRDCICRKQKALVGDPCEHPLEMCMVLAPVPGAFDGSTTDRALSREEALATLRRAAEAGLVHSISNTMRGMWDRRGFWYICNCCTCSCAVLRGQAELGIANVIARSPFVNQVDEALCIGCGECVESCPFGALSLQDVARVDRVRCVGCGVCTLACPQDALSLVRRAEDEIAPTPATESAWLAARATQRGLDLDQVV